MKLLLVAVGQRLPDWANTACAEYTKRFPPELRLELKAVKAEPRDGRGAAQLMAAEAKRIAAAIPRGSRVVALDERGDCVDTRALADRLGTWQRDGRDVALVIGGPDGIDETFKSSSDETIRLSDLTLPHAFARALLAEALYRAWSLSAGHPYHRE